MLPEIIGVCVYVVGTPDEQVGGVGVKNFVRNSNGNFTIYFHFDVVGVCMEIASIAEWEAPGCITAYGDPNIGSNVVSVRTSRPSGELWDMTFQLLVVQYAVTL